MTPGNDARCQPRGLPNAFLVTNATIKPNTSIAARFNANFSGEKWLRRCHADSGITT